MDGMPEEDFSIEVIHSKHNAMSEPNDVPPPIALLQLPDNIRMKIYDMLDSRSTIALSLTNRSILSDVERSKGFRVFLNRSNSSMNIDTIQQGTESLRIDNFLQPLPTLAYPDLLKELIISGEVIDPLSVNDLLRMTSQLQVLRLDHVRLARLNKSRFVQNVTCPNLRCLWVEGVKAFPSLFNFVYSHHSSLAELKLHITETTRLPKTTTSILKRKTTNLFFNLKHLSMTFARLSGEWVELLSSQNNLKYLMLKAKEFMSWEEIIGVGVLENCRSSLNTLIVENLYAEMSSLSRPVDLSLLQQCSSLRHLSLIHKPQGFFIPRVSHCDSLPPNLEQLSLAHFTLKPHQETTLLLKYSKLTELELCYWSESESNLNSFLSSLNFLLLMGLCCIKTVRLKELRSVMDSVHNEIQRLEVNHCIFTLHIGGEDGESVITITKKSVDGE